MNTCTVYIVHSFSSLFPKQISEAFKRFGISDGDDSVLVVLVHSKQESQLSEITAKVDGRQVPVADVSSLSDADKIRKV